jgi:CheY-like chemotaxis protein
MTNLKKALLAVDDEFIILESLRLQLERNFGEQFILEFADSAEYGLEILEELKEKGIDFFVVITDWMMPGLKGDEFARLIKKNYPESKVIMLTGQVDQNVLEKILEEKLVDKVISKPWMEWQIKESVEQAL